MRIALVGIACLLGPETARAITLTWSINDLLVALGLTTIGSGNTLNITTSADHDFNGLSFTNNGTINWQAGQLRTGNGGSVTNNATWNDSAGSNFINPFGGSASFTNALGATYNRSGSGQTTFYAPFTNNGAIVLSAGAFEFQGGGSFASTGTMSAASGTTVYFNSAFTLATSAALSGAGTYRLHGSTLTVNGNVSVSNFELAGGTLAGTHTLTGATAWKGSSLSSSGTTTIPSGSTLTISTTSDHDFTSRALVNNGTVNWQAGQLRTGNGGSITNNATWNDSSESNFTNPFGGSASFTNASGATYNRSGSGQTTFYAPFTNNGAIVLSAGAFEFQGGGSFGSTGTMSAATGTLVYFNSAFSLDASAALSGAGTYRLHANTLTVTGGVSISNFELTGGTLAGTHTLTGAIAWKGSSLSSSGTTTLPSGSTLTISTTADHDFTGRALVNNGTVNWQAGQLRTGNGGSITNNATWNDSAESNFINPFGGSASFTNASGATYNRSGSGQTTFSTPFYNNGAIVLSAGAFEVQGGGSFASTGTMSAATGTLVYFNSAFSLDAGAALSGAGTYRLQGNTLTVSGGVSISNFELTGGTLAGTHTLTGATAWKASSLSSSGTTTVPSGSTLTISTTADHDFTGRALVNNGIVNWQAGQLRTGNNGSVTNNATWNDSAGSNYLNPFGGAASFTNAAGATYNRSGSGQTTFYNPFTNNGAIVLSAGAFEFQGGGSFASTGTMSAATGTLVYFNSAFSLDASAALSGVGTYRLQGNTLTVSGSVSISNFELTGGTLAGTHTLAGVIAWKGSSLSSSGTTTIPSGSTLTISTTADHDFTSRALVNNGTVNWQAGQLRTGNGGSITNNATWNDSAGSNLLNPFGGSASFTNASGSTYKKTGSGTTTFSVPFGNTGTVEINGGILAFNSGYAQTAGALFLNNGNASASSFDLQGGTLKGSGTLTGNVSLGGNLEASPVTFNVGQSPGQLTITGNLTLLATAVTQIELGGTTQGSNYDFIDVTGTATLGGTLTLAFVDGFGSSVTNADTFTVLRAGSLTGAFSNITSGQYLTTTNGLAQFLVTQNATTLQLSQFTPVPEPSTWVLFATGGGLTAYWNWRRRRSR